MRIARPLASASRLPVFSTLRPFSAAAAAAAPPPLALADPKYSPGERTLHEKLANQLQATKLNVADISGGCGSMFAIEIASPLFKGKTLVKQHRMVTDILQEDIKGMHGIQIKTSPS
ncbi:hypothetical protein HDU90_009119 [Geranomyces variabilis]|nr:hypothetical protein HDU90_009119 [Geranomyces variabilis]